MNAGSGGSGIALTKLTGSDKAYAEIINLFALGANGGIQCKGSVGSRMIVNAGRISATTGTLIPDGSTADIGFRTLGGGVLNNGALINMATGPTVITIEAEGRIESNGDMITINSPIAGASIMATFLTSITGKILNLSGGAGVSVFAVLYQEAVRSTSIGGSIVASIVRYNGTLPDNDKYLLRNDLGGIRIQSDTDIITGKFLFYQTHPTFNADTQLIDKKYADDLPSLLLLTAVGALNSGSITSGFGLINNAASGYLTTGDIGANGSRVNKIYTKDAEFSNWPTKAGGSMNSNGIFNLPNTAPHLANIGSLPIDFDHWHFVSINNQPVRSIDSPTFNGMVSTGVIKDSISGVVNVVAASGVTAITDQTMVVQSSSAGDADISSVNPQIVAGAPGQRITLMGNDDVKTVTISDGNGLKLEGGAGYTFAKYDTIDFVFYNSRWVERGRSKKSV